MAPKPTILDRLSRSDDLLVENVEILRSLHAVLSREEERETRAVYFTYPDDGTLATLQTGTTVLNFKVGTIEDVDHNFTNMGHSLQSEGRDWLRSFFVNSDKNITVQPDDYDKIPATEEKDAIGIYQELTKLKITCTEETKVFVACCTSPEAVVRLISNAAVLTDPVNAFGHRTYIGAGELAARLGSINTYERRGQVIFMDDFEDSTLKWKTNGTGIDYSVLRSNEHALTKNYSMKLTTGKVEDNHAQIGTKLPLPVKQQMGFEFSFALGLHIKRVEFYSYPYDGTHYYTPAVRFSPQSDTLEIFDDTGTFQTISSTLKLREDGYLFHQMKAVFNIDDAKWMRIFVDGHEYDLSDYRFQKLETICDPYYYLLIAAYNNAAGNHYIYVDNVIITQGEPQT